MMVYTIITLSSFLCDNVIDTNTVGNIRVIYLNKKMCVNYLINTLSSQKTPQRTYF